MLTKRPFLLSEFCCTFFFSLSGRRHSQKEKEGIFPANKTLFLFGLLFFFWEKARGVRVWRIELNWATSPSSSFVVSPFFSGRPPSSPFLSKGQQEIPWIFWGESGGSVTHTHTLSPSLAPTTEHPSQDDEDATPAVYFESCGRIYLGRCVWGWQQE